MLLKTWFCENNGERIPDSKYEEAVHKQDALTLISSGRFPKDSMVYTTYGTSCRELLLGEITGDIDFIRAINMYRTNQLMIAKTSLDVGVDANLTNTMDMSKVAAGLEILINAGIDYQSAWLHIYKRFTDIKDEATLTMITRLLSGRSFIEVNSDNTANINISRKSEIIINAPALLSAGLWFLRSKSGLEFLTNLYKITMPKLRYDPNKGYVIIHESYNELLIEALKGTCPNLGGNDFMVILLFLLNQNTFYTWCTSGPMHTVSCNKDRISLQLVEKFVSNIKDCLPNMRLLGSEITVENMINFLNTKVGWSTATSELQVKELRAKVTELENKLTIAKKGTVHV